MQAAWGLKGNIREQTPPNPPKKQRNKKKKKRKRRGEEAKLAFTLVPGTVTCVISLKLHSKPLAGAYFYSFFFFVNTKVEVQRGEGTTPSSLSFSGTESRVWVNLSSATDSSPGLVKSPIHQGDKGPPLTLSQAQSRLPPAPP